jgi:hypothetical protein
MKIKLIFLGFIQVFDDSEFKPPTPEDVSCFKEKIEKEWKERKKQVDMEKQRKREQFMNLYPT